MASGDEFEGGELVYAGGTDFSGIGRSANKKKSTPAEAAREAARAEKYPNLADPHRLAALTGVKIKFIAAGCAASHALAIDADGRAFTWGRGEKGQLGHGSLLNYNTPTPVAKLDGIACVAGACGRGHTVVVTAGGDSWAWGNNSFGQLGTGSIAKAKGAEDLQMLPLKSMVAGAKSVSCGAEFSIWLTNDGKLYGAGNPQYGQLGDGSDHQYNAADSSIKLVHDPQPTPILIAALASVKIAAVACGTNHAIAADSEGSCYTWGFGGYGRLGHVSGQDDEHTPRKVEALTARYQVVEKPIVAAGGTSSFCLAVPGANYLMYWGKLKTSGDNQMKPVYLEDLAGWNIRSMACSNTTFAVAADNSSITWGAATAGELGYGSKGKKSSANPDTVKALEGVHCHQVAAGIGLTMFLLDPESEKVKSLPVWEPQEAIDDDQKATKKAADNAARAKKRKAAAAAPKKARAKK